MAEIIVMPKMNLTMEEGALVEWNKKVGDSVKVDELLCSIETEKAVADMESPASGILLKIWGVLGERYPVTTPIALIGQPDEDVSALIEQAENRIAGSKEQKPTEEIAVAVPAIPSETRVQAKMVPKVRKLVQELGIDVVALVAFCGGRRITEDEVRAFQKNSSKNTITMVQSDPSDRRVRMSIMRSTIAANMSESCQKTAWLTNITEIDMTRVMEMLNERKEEKISLTAVIVKACALAIKEHDIINTVVDGNEIIFRGNINVGVAVDIPGGLTVPVIHNADTKNIHTLTDEIVNYTDKARQGALTQEDLTGGTFTITNVGMLGIEVFTPIINYPQTAIMGIGTVSRLPRYLDDNSEVIESRHIMKLCLSYDHRVIDGAPAARFSLTVRGLLQKPEEIFG